MKCRNCGADNPTDATSCVYCQSQLPKTSSENTDLYAQVKNSDAYARRNSPERLAQLPKIGAFHKAFMVIFFAMFIGGSAVMCVVALGMAGVFGFIGSRGSVGFGHSMSIIPLFFAMVPMGFVAFGIFLLIKTRKKMVSLEEDPVAADAVIVVDKRTQVTGGSGDSSAQTHYFATCEGEDGRRKEYQLWDGNLYGRMSSGDAGVLFVRASYALDFDRVST